VVLSSSGNLIPGSASVKRQGGRGGSTVPLSDNSCDSAVSFKRGNKVACQTFLKK
jgi:hypothetical protein